MATYCLVFDPTQDWNPDPRWRFKTRRTSTKGARCAQPAFQERVNAGRYVKMIAWNNGAPSVVDEFCPVEQSVDVRQPVLQLPPRPYPNGIEGLGMLVRDWLVACAPRVATNSWESLGESLLEAIADHRAVNGSDSFPYVHDVFHDADALLRIRLGLEQSTNGALPRLEYGEAVYREHIETVYRLFMQALTAGPRA